MEEEMRDNDGLRGDVHSFSKFRVKSDDRLKLLTEEVDDSARGQVETTLIPSSRVLSLFYGPSDTCFARYLVGGTWRAEGGHLSVPRVPFRG